MANPLNQKAIDSTERQAHRINPGPKNPMKDQMLARIKAGFQPDGCFIAKAKDGAVVSLQANLNGGLILTIEGPGSRMEFMELSV